MNERTEHCSHCDRETNHEIHITFKETEGETQKQPQRVRTCTVCGNTEDTTVAHAHIRNNA